MSDSDLFRSLNAGLRIQVSDLTGHANVLTAKVAALEAENARLEKERFKYESCLMLISNGFPDAVRLASAALPPKVET